MIKKYRIGIDLGGTNISIGLVDKDFNISQIYSIKTRANELSADEILTNIAEGIKVVLKEANVSIDQCSTIGIGSPGSYDSSTGIIIYANNLDWHNVNLRTGLQKHFDLPVYISNDANCAAYGEFLAGAAKGTIHALMLTLGTGVGGGIIIDKKIYSGHKDGAGEVGHNLLIMDGYLCTCGRKGCLEAYASATGLIRITKDKMEAYPNSLMHQEAEKEGKVTGRTSFEAAKKGDKPAQEVVDLYIKYVSEGVIDFINIFRPEKVIIGGGISHEGAYLFDRINDYVKKEIYGGESVFVPPVVPAVLGNNAGIIGAAFLDE